MTQGGIIGTPGIVGTSIVSKIADIIGDEGQAKKFGIRTRAFEVSLIQTPQNDDGDTLDSEMDLIKEDEALDAFFDH